MSLQCLKKNLLPHFLKVVVFVFLSSRSCLFHSYLCLFFFERLSFYILDNFGVWRFKLAMWKVCGIKIEPAKFFHRNFVIFLVQRSVPKNFQREHLSGPVPTESLSTQDSENIIGFGWPSLRFEVIAAQSEVIGKNRSCYKISRGVQKWSHSATLETERTWSPNIGVHVLFDYSFPSVQTKIGGRTSFFDTAIALYPKVFKGSLKVDPVPIVWHTAPPKVRQPRFLAAKNGCFYVFFCWKLSWQNGRLSPKACHTYSESYCSSG